MSVYYEKILACIICKKIEAVIMLVIYIKERDCIRFALIKATRQPDALSEGSTNFDEVMKHIQYLP